MAPGPIERLVNSDGTATPALQSVIETLVNQAGGQGQDVVFYLAQQQAVIDGLLESITQVESRLGALVNAAEGQALGLLAGRDSLTRDLAAGDFAGVVASASSSSVDWVKSSVSPATKAVADYETHELETGEFTVRPGDRVEITFSYKNEGVKDMFEHGSFEELVEIMDGSTVVSTVNQDVYPFFSATNSGYINTAWSGEINLRQSEKVTVDVPNPLSGNWPADGKITVKMTHSPSSAASGGGSDCISGGTFDGASVKTNFKLQNRRIAVKLIPKEITELIG